MGKVMTCPALMTEVVVRGNDRGGSPTVREGSTTATAALLDGRATAPTLTPVFIASEVQVEAKAS